MANHRDPHRGRVSVNLYCAQCESQIGIFDNEWIRLTSSYARSQEKGTHFGTEVGNRTQVVPSGPAQRSAEGCVMAEVFCRKCSNMVGQYCKTAPDIEKQALVDQYFYKLSRTFLKDSRTNARVDPVFGYGSDIVKPTNSRPSITARTSGQSNSRWADTPLRQSSRTPAIPTPQVTRELVQKESGSTPTIVPNLKDEKWEKLSVQLQKLRHDMVSQQSISSEQSTQLFAQEQRLDEQEQFARDHEASFRDLDNYVSAQASRIVEQGETIKSQTIEIQQQQSQIRTITDQLAKLQKSMSDLKKQLTASRSNLAAQNLATPEYTDNNGDLISTTNPETTVQRHSDELQMLREENTAMKSKLTMITSAMGAVADADFTEECEDQLQSSTSGLEKDQVLGKRKRDLVGRSPSLGCGGSRVPGIVNVQSLETTEQMLTPQSSDGRQSSPAQPLSSTLPRPSNRYTAANVNRDPQRTAPVDEQMSEQPLLEEETGNSTMNNTGKSFIASADDDAPQEQQLMEKRGDIMKRSEKARTSDTGRGRRLRSSKLDDAVEVAVPDSEISVLESAKAIHQRSTRSNSKMAKASDDDDVPTHTQTQVGESANPLLHQPTLPGKTLRHTTDLEGNSTVTQQPLSTVQLASNILSVNPKALLASSQAVPQYTTLADAGIVDSEYDSVETDVDYYFNFPASDEVVTNSKFVPDHPVENDDGIEIIQDTDMYDVVNTGDDHNDQVMQTDMSRHGSDDREMGDGGLFDGDSSSINGLPLTTDLETEASDAIIGEDRDLALEPTKQAKTRVGRHRDNIDIDDVHIATPAMFAEAYADGRRPREARSPAYTGRDRLLNIELKQIGLSEWIGKDKSSKEYRVAVAAARARWRDLNKQAFLSSRAVNHTPSSSTTIPAEQAVTRSTRAHQNVPLSDIQNLPTASEILPNENVHDDKNSRIEEEMQEEPARTTRFRGRRKSISLALGPDKTQDPTSLNMLKRAKPKRKSISTRRSKHNSGTVKISTDASDLEIDAVDGLEESIVDGAVMETSLMETLDEPVEEQHTVWRRRSRPKRRTASNVLPSVDEDQSEGVIAFPNDQPLPVKGVPRKPALSKVQAQQLEEAILLRDRLAKELMERESMDT